MNLAAAAKVIFWRGSVEEERGHALPSSKALGVTAGG